MNKAKHIILFIADTIETSYLDLKFINTAFKTIKVKSVTNEINTTSNKITEAEIYKKICTKFPML